MLLYLVRHGEAAQADTSDFSRALSERGITETEEIAAHLSSLDISVPLIVHSTKARAKQTAGIIAAGLKPVNGIAEDADLSPLADPAIWARRLEGMSDNLMIVGHMPYMSRMASLLTSGFCNDPAFAFDTSTVGCLVRENGIWSVLWMITPALIRRI
jgi:phosphohistidine phosphatase